MEGQQKALKEFELGRRAERTRTSCCATQQRLSWRRRGRPPGAPRQALSRASQLHRLRCRRPGAMRLRWGSAWRMRRAPSRCAAGRVWQAPAGLDVLCTICATLPPLGPPVVLQLLLVP